MKEISQRALRNESGEIMRAVDRGESFVVTRNGVPVAELRPFARKRFVKRDIVMASIAGAARIEGERFRRDVDRMLDQGAEPRTSARKRG